LSRAGGFNSWIPSIDALAAEPVVTDARGRGY
jgi:hypothetical protein